MKHLDLILPAFVCFGVSVAVAVIGSLAGWPHGTTGSLAVGAVILGALLRVTMHDYSSDRR